VLISHSFSVSFLDDETARYLREAIPGFPFSDAEIEDALLHARQKLQSSRQQQAKVKATSELATVTGGVFDTYVKDAVAALCGVTGRPPPTSVS